MPRIDTRDIIHVRDRKVWSVTPISSVIKNGCRGNDYIHTYGMKRAEPPSVFRNENFGTFTTFYRERSDIIKGDRRTDYPYSCIVHENRPGSYRTSFRSPATQEGYNCQSHFFHSMDYDREEITCDRWFGNRLGAYITPYYNPFLGGQRNIADDMQSTLTRGLHEKIHKNRAAFGTTLGELGKTARWLEKRASGVINSVAYVSRTGKLPHLLSPRELAKAISMSKIPLSKKRILVSKAHALKSLPVSSIPLAASRIWLEYRYALLPFIKDVDTAMRYLVFRRQEFVFVVSKADSSEFQNAYTIKGSGFENQISTSGSIGAYMKIRASVNNPLRYVLADAGLDITQIPQTAYELLPFSWMVDWSWNVSEFLMQMSSFTGLVFRGGFYSWKITAQSTDTISYRPIGGGKYGNHGSANFFSKTTMFRRLPLKNFPYFKLSHDNPFGLKRLVDLVALLTTFRQARLNPNLRI